MSGISTADDAAWQVVLQSEQRKNDKREQTRLKLDKIAQLQAEIDEIEDEIDIVAKEEDVIDDEQFEAMEHYSQAWYAAFIPEFLRAFPREIRNMVYSYMTMPDYFYLGSKTGDMFVYEEDIQEDWEFRAPYYLCNNFVGAEFASEMADEFFRHLDKVYVPYNADLARWLSSPLPMTSIVPKHYVRRLEIEIGVPDNAETDNHPYWTSLPRWTIEEDFRLSVAKLNELFKIKHVETLRVVVSLNHTLRTSIPTYTDLLVPTLTRMQGAGIRLLVYRPTEDDEDESELVELEDLKKEEPYW